MATDFAHREALGKLLRFESSRTEKGKITSLADYVKRMPDEQKEIYYLLGPNREAAESSPYFEVFRRASFEVLFLYDPWDEFVMEHLREFDGKKLAPPRRPTSNRRAAREGRRVRGEARPGRSPRGSRRRSATASARSASRSGSSDSPAVVVDADPHHDGEHAAHDEGRPESKAAGPDAKHDLEINPATR